MSVNLKFYEQARFLLDKGYLHNGEEISVDDLAEKLSVVAKEIAIKQWKIKQRLKLTSNISNEEKDADCVNITVLDSKYQ